MRGAAVFCAAVLVGALAVHGQEEDGLEREIARLTALLEAHAQRARPDAAKVPVVRIYDVSDLCAPVQDEVMEPTNVFPSRSKASEIEVPEPRRPYDVDQLIDLMRYTVEPSSWDMLEGADIQPKNNRLFITTLPRVHDKVARLLASIRKTVRAQVVVEIAAVPVSAEAAALLAGRPRELAPEEAQRLLASSSLGTVRIVCSEGQQVVQRSGRRRSYLQDFEVEIAQAASIGDPIRKSLFDGFAAEVRPCLDRGGQGAVLHLRIERTRVREPIRTASTEHGAVELPDMQLTRVNASVWTPLGRTIVAGGCTAGEEPCVFLVTTRVME